MYKLVGADNREYGPVSREAVLEWIAQGRANGQTIARFEDGAWKPLRSFEEFQAALGAAGGGAGSNVPPINTWATAPEASVFNGVSAQRQTNWPAVLGLIASIVCCCCPFVGPILGLALSATGYAQIRSHPNVYSTSAAIPMIGIIISVMMIALQVVGRLMDNRLQDFLRQLIPNIPQ
jgi:hypothetical protein